MNRYEGEWEKDKKHGRGTYRHQNSSKYEGNWKMGKKDGFGVFYFPDGERYEGIIIDMKLKKIKIMMIIMKERMRVTRRE